MTDWSQCTAMVYIVADGPIDLGDVPDQPTWMQDLLVDTHDWAHDIAHLAGLAVTCHLWLRGDENRALPMPLRYAAPQPQSAGAILGVLKCMTERPVIGNQRRMT